MHKTTKNYAKQAAPRHWRLTGFYTGFSTPKPVKKNGLKIKPVPPSSVYTHSYCVCTHIHTVCVHTYILSTLGDRWSNGWHVCFPSLPTNATERVRVSVGLEFFSFGMWHFLKLIFIIRGFLWVLWFPPLLHWIMVSAKKIKAKINAISTLSNLTVPSYHVVHDMLQVICTPLRPGHLSICVEKNSQRSEEIVKNLKLHLSM